MWLLRSSIGRKSVMSITGIALVLFLLFHLSMNVAAVFSADAYNAICTFLGANWYAVAATLGLGALAFLHIAYSMLLTLQNRKARGQNRYAVNKRPKGVSWASQNMFVLGTVVCGFLLLHLWQFWYKMMFAELNGQHEVALGGSMVSTQDGYAFICYYFSQTWVVIAYLLWYVALWLHLTHGFWSAMQSLGWNNHIWFERWKWMGNAVSTLIMLGFALVTLFFYIK
ncbi:MAG: succinate dehydrogenase cytochrome b subunit [Tannerella sp.]|jgi:succinate dehydrogenase / fumarate reductase cytochrome b subunit|nr:succinate dehydrogenase cytochrome b subunit [Tannerella sp.]